MTDTTKKPLAVAVVSFVNGVWEVESNADHVICHTPLELNTAVEKADVVLSKDLSLRLKRANERWVGFADGFSTLQSSFIADCFDDFFLDKFKKTFDGEWINFPASERTLIAEHNKIAQLSASRADALVALINSNAMIRAGNLAGLFDSQEIFAPMASANKQSLRGKYTVFFTNSDSCKPALAHALRSAALSLADSPARKFLTFFQSFLTAINTALELLELKDMILAELQDQSLEGDKIETAFVAIYSGLVMLAAASEDLRLKAKSMFDPDSDTDNRRVSAPQELSAMTPIQGKYNRAGPTAAGGLDDFLHEMRPRQRVFSDPGFNQVLLGQLAKDLGVESVSLTDETVDRSHPDLMNAVNNMQVLIKSGQFPLDVPKQNALHRFLHVVPREFDMPRYAYIEDGEAVFTIDSGTNQWMFRILADGTYAIGSEKFKQAVQLMDYIRADKKRTH